MSANRLGPAPSSAASETDEALLISVLSAFPDRVAKRRKAGARELLLAGGGSAMLSPASVVQEPFFIVAVDAEEQKEKLASKASGPKIRLASAIEVEWLAGLFPESISQKTELVWNERAGRVDEIRRTSYEQISLEETAKTAPPSEEAAHLLASAVLSMEPLPFHDVSSLQSLRSRLSLLSQYFPQENPVKVSEQEIRTAVESLCAGKRSLAQLASSSIVNALMDMLTDRQRALLRQETPERIKLKSGRIVKVHYENMGFPWIESRLQDFFGTYTTPVLCAGRMPLTVHLLAPNGRAVQVTKDLAGFWGQSLPGYPSRTAAAIPETFLAGTGEYKKRIGRTSCRSMPIDIMGTSDNS